MNRIEMKPDGPYHCTGRLHLKAADGSAIAEVDETWLCACGASKDKPYCDGSHALTHFTNTPAATPAPVPSADGGAPSAGPPASASASAAGTSQHDASPTLSIRTRRDGPLKLDGPCEVVAPDGTVLLRGAETALCRCGHSRSKPFCDGSHRGIGFRA